MSTISKLRRVCLAVVITFSVCLSATSKEELSVKPTAKELVNLYKKAVTCWDKSVAMRVETEHSMAKRGTDETDIRHWKYDITHSREGDRCEWFGSCQFEGEHDGDEYSFNEQFTKKVGDDFFLYYIKRDSGEEPEFALMGSNVKEKLFILQAQESDAGFLQGRMGGIGSAPKMVNVMCESKNLNLTQGAKRVVLGGDTYVYDTHHFLITSVDIPTTVQVIKASHQKPCLGLVLKLDLREISQLVVDGNLPQPRVEPSSRGMALGEVTLPMLDAFKRLIDLLDEPKDIPILAPVVKREIFYRILVGNQGTRLRQMASAGSPSHQIARAIDWIKDNFTEPLHVENL